MSKKKKSKPVEKKKAAKKEPSITAEDLEKLVQAAAKSEEYLDLARRAKADFENYQNRMRRELQAASRYAIDDFVREFLPAMDAIRESLRSARNGASAEALLKGVELIEKEFLRVLGKSGIKPIEAEGKPFDPAFHEVVLVLPDSDAPPNTVAEEVRRGWVLHDRVLRPAMVKIAAPAAEKSDASKEKAEKEGQKEREAGEEKGSCESPAS